MDGLANEMFPEPDMTTYVFGKTRPCPVCGHVGDPSDFINDTLYIKCMNCGVSYAFPSLSDSEHDDFINMVLPHQDMIDNYMNGKFTIKQDIHHTICLVRNIIPHLFGEVLVVGSGIGDIIESIKEYSGSVIGIESNPKKIDIGRLVEYKHNVYPLRAEDMRFFDRFNTVFVRNVLSWTDKPFTVIGNVLLALKQNILHSRSKAIFYIDINVPDYSKIYRILWQPMILQKIISNFGYKCCSRQIGSKMFIVVENTYE